MQKRTAAPVTLPKPRVTLHANGERSIDFGNGATATMYQCSNPVYGPEEWRASVTMPDGTDHYVVAVGESYAFTRAWQYAVQASAPAPVYTAEQVAELAKRAEEGDRSEATKIMRKILKDRTGIQFQVKGNRGTAYGWLRIDIAPKRYADARLRAHDAALLAAVLGETHCDVSGGEQVRPGRGVRAAYVYRLAGHPIPDTLEIQERQWD